VATLHNAIAGRFVPPAKSVKIQSEHPIFARRFDRSKDRVALILGGSGVGDKTAK
jgi:hypothetical protein